LPDGSNPCITPSIPIQEAPALSQSEPKLETEKPVDASRNAYRWVMLAGVWLIYCSFGVTVASIAPLVPEISRDLDMSYGAMGIVLGAWPFVYIGASLPCGMLLDRIGPAKGLFLAALIMALSGGLRGFAQGDITLILAVAVFGLGGPMISIGAPKLIALLFEGRDRGLAMGIYITGPGMGGVASMALTNSVMMPALGHDWRLVVTAYAGFTILSGLIWLLISLHPSARALEARLAAEPRGAILDTFRRLAAIPTVRIVLIMSIGIFFFNHGLNNWLPELLRSKDLDIATAGFWAAIPTGVSVLAALTIPRLATPERRLKIFALLILGAAVTTALLHLQPGPALGIGLILQGLARGAMMTVALLMLVEVPGVGAKRAGTAGGLFFTAAEIGGVSGPLVIGLLHDATGGFTAALIMLSVICAALLGMLLILRQSMERDATR
jgi:CP family cyanate transporter-like MFS transporter